MSQSQQKLVQYLNEAHATEMGLVRVLQSQIAMTPRGSYRDRARAAPATRRAGTPTASQRAPASSSSTAARTHCRRAVGARRDDRGQTLALWKAPFDLLRGTSGEEKVLKNAKDASATEALEIATYLALERLAKAVGDDVDREAGGVDPRGRGADARARHARDPQARGGRGRRGDRGRTVLRRVQDRRGRRAARRRGDQHRSADQAHLPHRAQAAPAWRARRARPRARSPRRGPADRALRQADRRGDHGPADSTSRRPTWRRSPSTSARTTAARRCSTGSHRCGARSRGRATTSSRSRRSAPRWATTSSASSACVTTSVRTRTVRACSRPPSASSRTPEAPPGRPRPLQPPRPPTARRLNGRAGNARRLNGRRPRDRRAVAAGA